MLFTCLKKDFSNMFRRKEFLFGLSASMVIILGSFIISLFSFYQKDVMYHFPAWFYWGASGTGYSTGPYFGNTKLTSDAISIFLTLFLPFVCVLGYSYIHLDNVKSGINQYIIPRTGAFSYYRSAAITSFLGGFLILFLPLLLEQVLLCIVFPCSSDFFTGYYLSDNYATEYLGLPDYLVPLQLNHPYGFNLLYSLIPGISGGLVAFGSYVVSLYYQKSRFLALTSIGVIGWIVLPLILSANPDIASKFGAYSQTTPSGNLLWWILTSAVLLLLAIFMMELKIHKSRDTLN